MMNPFQEYTNDGSRPPEDNFDRYKSDLLKRFWTDWFQMTKREDIARTGLTPDRWATGLEWLSLMSLRTFFHLSFEDAENEERMGSYLHVYETWMKEDGRIVTRAPKNLLHPLNEGEERIRELSQGKANYARFYDICSKNFTENHLDRFKEHLTWHCPTYHSLRIEVLSKIKKGKINKESSAGPPPWGMNPLYKKMVSSFREELLKGDYNPETWNMKRAACIIGCMPVGTPTPNPNRTDKQQARRARIEREKARRDCIHKLLKHCFSFASEEIGAVDDGRIVKIKESDRACMKKVAMDFANWLVDQAELAGITYGMFIAEVEVSRKYEGVVDFWRDNLREKHPNEDDSIINAIIARVTPEFKRILKKRKTL